MENNQLPLKHITLVGPLPPPAGGMANQTRKLAEFLRQQDKQVNIVQVNASYRPAWVGKVPVLRAGFRLLDYLFCLRRALKHTELVHIMANSGWSWYLFAVPAIYVARRYQKPVIINYRGGYAREFFAESWPRVAKSLAKVQGVLVPSPFLQQVFADFGQQAEIVPNVLDQALFKPESEVDSQSGLAPHIIVTRNLEAIYDVTTAIKSFAKTKQVLTGARLSVAGTGPELVHLQALVAKLGLNESVDFTGRLTPEQMAKLYKSANLMLNSSRVDNTPNSIIEALACGTPVVSTNVGGIPKLVSHNHDALLVEPGAIDDMANYALELLQNQDKREQIVANGLNTVSQFFWPNVWQKLQHCYQQAMLANQIEASVESGPGATGKLDKR